MKPAAYVLHHLRITNQTKQKPLVLLVLILDLLQVLAVVVEPLVWPISEFREPIHNYQLHKQSLDRLL